VRRRSSVRLTFFVVLASLVPAATAQGHAKLMSTTPSSGQTVAAPATLTLRFDDVVQLPADALRVSGPAGNPVAVRKFQPDSKTLAGSLPGKLGAGHYTVRWRIVADDGHVKSGTFSFAVRAGAKRASAGAALPVRRSKTSSTAVVLTLLLGVVTIAALGTGLVRLRRERSAR